MFAIENLHIHNHVDMEGINQKMDQILTLLRGIKREEVIMVQEIQDLIDEVTEVKTVEASAAAAIAVLIDKFNNAIQAATDLEEAKAAAVQVTADLKEATAPLSAAIANVPA